MNYPIESLAIIAPTIFVILVVAFPLIGVFAGWKRAAYWGGGNFVFYILGLIIWLLAGNAIAAAIKPMITNLLGSLAEGLEVDNALISSLMAPVWFLLFMAVSELILLINYYAWYKKVVGLKKVQVKTKNGIVKKYAKVDKNADTVGYKVGNKLGGAALLGILTLPTTMAFTQVIYNGTTSAKTRVNNIFSSGLYNGLSALSTGAFSWLAYNPNSTKDFDALYSAITLFTNDDILEQIENSIGREGLINLFSLVKEGTSTEGAVKGAVGDIATSWNQIIDSNGEDLTSVFKSENAVSLVQQVIDEKIGDVDPIELEDKAIADINNYIEYYQKKPEWASVQLETIETTKTNFDEIANIFSGYIHPKSEDPEKIIVVEKAIKNILGMFLTYPDMPNNFNDE